MTPLFGVVGWKNSGKTTLMTKLIAEFAARGLRVAAIKHAHHGFDIDHAGRDSFRYREAGATSVVVSSAVRFAVMTELGGAREPNVQELAHYVPGADLILVEGFKAERHPKIETRRLSAANQTPLSLDDPSIRAIAADFGTEGNGLPVFDLDAAGAIAAFILAAYPAIEETALAARR